MTPHLSRIEGDVKGRILRAALQQLLTHGTRQLKSAQVAAAAGTSESTMFRHYADLPSVLRALYDSCWATLNQYLSDAAFECPSPTDNLQALLAEFDRIFSLTDDEMLRDCVTVAFTYYRRPLELGDGGYLSPDQLRFERRMSQLCRHVIADSPTTVTAESLQRLLTNFAATVWLTWTYMPPTGADLTREEARLGILSLVETYAPGATRRASGDHAA